MPQLLCSLIFWVHGYRENRELRTEPLIKPISVSSCWFLSRRASPNDSFAESKDVMCLGQNHEGFSQTAVQFYYLKLFSKLPCNTDSYFILFPSTNIKYEVRSIFFLLLSENLMDFFFIKSCKRDQGIGTNRHTLKHTERDT